MQIIKKLFCSHFSVNKGLIQHVVQSCYNYNITFRKLEIHMVQMRPISACYTSGRGARHFVGIGRGCTSKTQTPLDMSTGDQPLDIWVLWISFNADQVKLSLTNVAIPSCLLRIDPTRRNPFRVVSVVVTCSLSFCTSATRLESPSWILMLWISGLVWRLTYSWATIPYSHHVLYWAPCLQLSFEPQHLMLMLL